MVWSKSLRPPWLSRTPIKSTEAKHAKFLLLANGGEYGNKDDHSFQVADPFSGCRSENEPADLARRLALPDKAGILNVSGA